MFAEKGSDLFLTIFPKEKTAFTIESNTQNYISYSRYDDTKTIEKHQNKTLDVTEFHNSKRHIFSAKYLNFKDSTINETSHESITNTINTNSNNPTFIDKMYQLPIGKTFKLYVKETGEGFASLDIDKLTSGANELILPTVTKGLANFYLKNLDYTFNEDASLRLIESAMVMPHKYNWSEVKIQDTINNKVDYHYNTTLYSICGIKAEFKVEYKVKKVSKEKYILIGTGNGIQHFNEETITLWLGEGKMFGVRPKDIAVNVEIEVDRTTGLVNKAIYKTKYHHTAQEETSPGKPNNLMFDVEWSCTNIVTTK